MIHMQVVVGGSSCVPAATCARGWRATRRLRATTRATSRHRCVHEGRRLQGEEGRRNGSNARAPGCRSVESFRLLDWFQSVCVIACWSLPLPLHHRPLQRVTSASGGCICPQSWPARPAPGRRLLRQQGRPQPAAPTSWAPRPAGCPGPQTGRWSAPRAACPAAARRCSGGAAAQAPGAVAAAVAVPPGTAPLPASRAAAAPPPASCAPRVPHHRRWHRAWWVSAVGGRTGRGRAELHPQTSSRPAEGR